MASILIGHRVAYSVEAVACVSTPEYQECRLSEGDEHILTLRVPRCGLLMKERKPMVTFSVRDGELIRTAMPHHGTARNALLPRNCFSCNARLHPEEVVWSGDGRVQCAYCGSAVRIDPSRASSGRAAPARDESP